MRLPPGHPKPFILLIPLAGMGLFIILYILAAFNYPGGSWVSPQHPGFSFWNNYLCDLLDYRAINGELNSALYLARAALGVLCLSLLLLWYYLPAMFSQKSYNKTLMWIMGIMSFLVTIFLTSGTHDVTLRIAGIFGSIAFVSCFIELFKAGYYRLFILGVACHIIFLVNYYIYETGEYISMLPSIQKITFTSCILWFALMDITFYIKLKSEDGKDIATY